MTQNDVYKLIRSIKSINRVQEEDMFYGVGDDNILKFEYQNDNLKSAISFVCPKDEKGDFMLIDITEDGTDFTLINKGGSQYTPVDLSTEDNFFQTSTIIDLGFTYDELCEIRMNFLKYYNGLIDRITIYI